MYKAIILPHAKLDVLNAISWYNSKQKGLGKGFAKEVRSKVQFISEYPTASAIRYDDIRCAVLDVFPRSRAIASRGLLRFVVTVLSLFFLNIDWNLRRLTRF